MKKTILIFGASGFIGIYLADELLRQKYKVVAADICPIGEMYYNNLDVPYLQIDIANKTHFTKIPNEKFDAVINLACMQPANVSHEKYDPIDYIKVNTIGTLNVLDFCHKHKAGKFIYTSSHRNTQGLWHLDKPISENDGRAIKYKGEYSMFSISETAAQDCIEYYTNQHELRSIIFRLPPVYGYGPHTEIFMNGKPIKTGFQIFIENAQACKTLEVWGDSSKGRDIVYIKDVVNAFIKAIKNNIQGLYNIASGRKITLKEEAEIIAKVFWGNTSKPEIIERPEIQNSIESYEYDITKAKNEFGWQPEYDFEKMIIDYKKEMESGRFDFLIKKRREMISHC